MATDPPNPHRDRRHVAGLALTVAAGVWRRADTANWDLGAVRRPARLLGLQRPDRGRDRVEGQDLRQLPGAGPGDGLPRRHPGGADRRRRRSSSAGCAGATTAALPAQQRPHLRDSSRWSAASPSTRSIDGAGLTDRRPGLLPAASSRLFLLALAINFVMIAGYALLPRAQLLRRQGPRRCRRCCPPSSRRR